jgi:hypothetical protein
MKFNKNLIKKVVRTGKTAISIANAFKSGNAPKVVTELIGRRAAHQATDYLDSRFAKHKSYRLAKGAYNTYNDFSSGNVVGGIKSGYALGKEIIGKKRSRQLEDTVSAYTKPNEQLLSNLNTGYNLGKEIFGARRNKKVEDSVTSYLRPKSHGL